MSQYFHNRSSVKVDYRYYEDDWGIESHTIGVSLNQYVTDKVIVRYRYRYYTQMPTYFYRDEYTVAGGVGGFQTNDYRLGDYGAHLFGGRVVVVSRGSARRASDSSTTCTSMLSYERYFNSNNFSANIIETGLRVAF